MGEEEEGRGELRERVRASTMGEESWGEEEGPKIRRSFSSDGVNGIVISSCSGRGKSCGGGGMGLGFLLGLRYGSRGSDSIAFSLLSSLSLSPESDYSQWRIRLTRRRNQFRICQWILPPKPLARMHARGN